MDEAKIAKLAKWAQAEVRALIRRVEEAEFENEQLRATTFGDEGSNTYLQPYDDQPVLLPNNGLVEYRLGYGSEDRVQVHVDHRNPDRLEIRGLVGIKIYPAASNVVMVEIAE